jgi:hypothetical protein
MANQIRSGGTQKTTIPLATENGVRRVNRGVQDIYGLSSVNRLFKDVSIDDPKLVNGGGIPGCCLTL